MSFLHTGILFGTVAAVWCDYIAVFMTIRFIKSKNHQKSFLPLQKNNTNSIFIFLSYVLVVKKPPVWVAVLPRNII
ncbi:hypothetical protein [Laribacter hongkongensis]|uniref:hypothetical protein n=1 Tax=Laribacter hongkongensis TaxID=168471 RepID=UPI001EFC3983|nr:hypothetical protein [Laribacter hongkongensis]